MTHQTFVALPSCRIAREISAARQRVVYAAPGIDQEIAEAVLSFAGRSHGSAPAIVLDCDEEVCRLGYGEIKAVRLLVDSGCMVRQSPGLRVGILICDDRAWCFSPAPLCVEDEADSDETPNSICLLPSQAEAIARAVCGESQGMISLFGKPELPSPGASPIPNQHAPLGPEIGVASLCKEEVANVEEVLTIAPPVPFDLAKQVRVFQPY